MSWAALLALSAISYGLKALGPLALGARTPPPLLERVIALIAVPLLAALIVVQALGAGRSLVLDARLAALAVAAVCVWRRLPFLVTVLAAAATAAGYGRCERCSGADGGASSATIGPCAPLPRRPTARR